jgi:hypothetical protein
MQRDPALKHPDTFLLGLCVALHYQFDPANSSFFAVQVCAALAIVIILSSHFGLAYIKVDV